MTGKSYSLHRRESANGKKIYYCQFRLPSGKWSSAKSTGETARRRAEAWAEEYLANGQIIQKSSVTLFEFSGYDFFNYGNDWELSKRLSKKRSPSPRWCMECADLLKNHVIPRLGDYRLTLVDELAIEEVKKGLHLNGYSRSYINKILGTIKAILEAAFKQRLIQRVPAIEAAGGDEHIRGKLTRDEVQRLFAAEWDSELAYLVSLAAAVTGMRLSEIQALRVNDINMIDGTFTINKAWEYRTKTVKPRTKNGQERIGRLPPDVLARLAGFIESHPFRNENGFLFYYAKSPEQPASSIQITRPYHAALACIGIDKAERERRGICFHSWRYYCNSALIEAGLPSETVRAMIGHTQDGAKMTQRYYRPENTSVVVQAMNAAVPIPRGEGKIALVGKPGSKKVDGLKTAL